MPSFRKDLIECLPKSESPIARGKLGRDRQAFAFQIDQQFLPALGTLAETDLKAEKLLLAFGRGADDHQHAFGLALHPGLQVDAVRPHIDIALPGEIPFLPGKIVGIPFPLEPTDHRRRQVRCIRAKQGGQRFLKVARRHAAQIQYRQKSLEARRAARPTGQDRRSEPDPRLGLAGGAVTDLGPLNRDRANAGLDVALGTVAVSDKTGATVLKLPISHQPQKDPGFHLNRLDEQALRA